LAAPKLFFTAWQAWLYCLETNNNSNSRVSSVRRIASYIRALCGCRKIFPSVTWLPPPVSRGP